MSETNRAAGRGMGKGRGSGGLGGGHGHGMPVEKPKNFKSSLRRLVKYLARHRAALAVVLVTAILGTVFSIFGPKILGQATTELFAPMAAKAEAFSELKEILPADLADRITSGEIPQDEIMSAIEQNVDLGRPENIAALKDAYAKYQAAQQRRIDFAKVGGILLTVIALYLISALFTFIMNFVMAKTSQQVVYDMRRQVDEKLARLPLKYFDGRTHGEILSRVTNDIDTISTTLSQGLTQVITSVVTLVGIVVMMLTISWVITLVTLVALPLSFVLVQLIVKKSQKYFKGRQEELGHINGHVEEMYGAHTVVKAFGREDNSVARFDEINQRLYTVGWKAEFLSGIMMPLMHFVSNLSYVLVCAIGGIMVIGGRISIGDVQAFIQYSRQFTQPITQVAQIANVLQSTVAAAERVFEVLDEEEMPPDSHENVIEYPKGAVQFEHVSFGYHPDVTVIKDLNLTVTPGDVVAIVGPTGAGKTTIVNLLMRFYDVDEGRILVDGVDIRTLPRENLRKQFGMVLQDTWLFGGTIMDNIRYGRADATDEEVYRAAKMAHADHFIRSLPEGYNTVLNEEASNISQGQRQLITIARALLADPPILILDEATSSVDTRTEAYIQNAMIALMKGRTSFVIAHRLSTIRNASTILVMNEGRIIEQGNHAELMALGGFYADLYNSQFAGAAV
ncbi:MAG: ABC transporter ATP-binding protein [Christensenellaceae bacterium]|nr:ABC transporter ATP-binding protein [Christensenellaceae bacterium]